MFNRLRRFVIYFLNGLPSEDMEDILESFNELSDIYFKQEARLENIVNSSRDLTILTQAAARGRDIYFMGIHYTPYHKEDVIEEEAN